MGKTLKVLIFISIVLVVIRVSLPVLGKSYINNSLENSLDNYEGEISDFDLSIINGAYYLKGLRINKKKSLYETPLLEISEIELEISWRNLFNGDIATHVKIESPKIEFRDSKNSDQDQLGEDEPTSHWSNALDVIFPVSVESLNVNNGSIRFKNNDVNKLASIDLSEIELEIQRIQTHNRQKRSPVNFKGVFQGHAPIEAQGALSVLSDEPEWDINFSLLEFNLTTINKLLRVYIPIDVTQGILSVYGESISENDAVDGYAKVFLKQADIIEIEQDYKGTKHFLIEIASGFSYWLLKNINTENTAAVVPFKKKTGEDWEIDGSNAFWSAIENKFDQIKPKIDNKLTL